MSVKSVVTTYCPAFLRPAFNRIENPPIGYRLAKGVFWSMAGAINSRGLMLCATVLVARILGKTVYGELGMIQSTVGMFGTFAGFGLGLTATKHVAELREKDPERAGRVWALAVNMAINWLLNHVNDFCCNCGICSGACPAEALPMRIQPNGDLAPDIIKDRCESKPNCRLCLRACPMMRGVHDPRAMNEQLFRRDSDSQVKFHNDIGWYRNAVVGARTDSALRRVSASGGLVTWCLERLLIEGAVTRVAVVRWAKQHDKGMFEFFPATTVEELRNSAGSIYQPIEISGVIREVIADRKQRWAIVGVPCLCAGIRNLKHVRKQITYVLGMACGMYQNIFYTELLLDKCGMGRDEVKGIQYRGQPVLGGASNFLFRGLGTTRQGRMCPTGDCPAILARTHTFA